MTKERNKGYYYFIAGLSAFLVAAMGVYATSIGTNLAVTGTIESTGAATMSSTLTVSGNSSLASADIGGAYSAGGSGSTITAAGKAQFNGDLEINGFATTTAATGHFDTEAGITASSSMAIGGVSTFYGNILANGFGTTTAATGTFDTEGSLIASSTLAIGGVSTFYDDVRVNGFATTTAATGHFDTEAGITASSSMAIGGVSTFYGNILANGFGTTTAATGTFDTEGSLIASSTLAVGGVSTFYNDLRVNRFATTTASNGNFASQGTIGAATTTAWGNLSAEMDTTNPSFVVANRGSSTPALIVGGVNENGRVGIASTTPSKELGVAGDAMFISAATTTITISSTGAVGGGCLQMENGAGATMYRVYINAAGNALVVEAGACQ